MIQLQLDVNEVNAIMLALGQMPYVQVEALVSKIREQATPQVQKPAEE